MKRGLTRRLVPTLYYRHRGYFLVVAGLLWVHCWLAVDEFLPEYQSRHAAPALQIHNQLLPGWAWGTLHLIMVLLTVLGLWHQSANLTLIRSMCAISASIFTVIGLSSLLSSIQNWPHASFQGIALAGFAAFVAIATLLEPSENPANQMHDRGVSHVDH